MLTGNHVDYRKLVKQMSSNIRYEFRYMCFITTGRELHHVMHLDIMISGIHVTCTVCKWGP